MSLVLKWVLLKLLILAKESNKDVGLRAKKELKKKKKTKEREKEGEITELQGCILISFCWAPTFRSQS